MLFAIPARNPEPVLISIVRELISSAEDPTFIIVDDGSDTKAAAGIFDALKSMAGVSLLRHPDNLGKGAALKTAIREAQSRGAPMIVTADADGQHTAADILRVAQSATGRDRMHIGARQFGANVPFRSKFGNLLTRCVFNLVCGIKVTDTQSGLRAIPARFFSPLLAVPLDRYDFETEALLLIATEGKIEEVPIQTIYEPGNPTSFFKPIRDSLRIYHVLFRYGLAVPAIAIIDFLAFWALSGVYDPSIAFLIVRALTIGIYFWAMRKFVFRSNTMLGPQIAKFIVLCLVNILVSISVLGYTTTAWALPPVAGYLLASVMMLALNFLIMSHAIFGTKPAEGENT